MRLYTLAFLASPYLFPLLVSFTFRGFFSHVDLRTVHSSFVANYTTMHVINYFVDHNNLLAIGKTIILSTS